MKQSIPVTTVLQILLLNRMGLAHLLRGHKVLAVSFKGHKVSILAQKQKLRSPQAWGLDAAMPFLAPSSIGGISASQAISIFSSS